MSTTTDEKPTKEASKKTSRLTNYDIEIDRIVGNDNSRNPLSPLLQKMGYDVFVSENGKPSLWSLLTSESAGERNLAANLVTENDPELTALAANVLALGQLQSCEARDTGKGTFVITIGMRRCLAIALNRALVGTPEKPTVRVTLVKGSAASLYVRNYSENVFRRPMTEIEFARALERERQQGESLDRLVEKTGLCKKTIEDRLMLLELPPNIQNRIGRHDLKVTRALDLARYQRKHGSLPETSPAGRKRTVRPKKEIMERLATETNEKIKEVLQWVLNQPEE